MIDISVPINTSRYRAPASVLNVNLTTRNREKGRLLLNALSERYLRKNHFVKGNKNLMMG